MNIWQRQKRSRVSEFVEWIELGEGREDVRITFILISAPETIDILVTPRAAGTLDFGKPLAAFSSRSLLRRYRTLTVRQQAGFTQSANRLAQSKDGSAVRIYRSGKL